MGTLRLLITGAGGYVGRHAVAEARRRNHAVIAVLRPGTAVDEAWRTDAGVEVLTCDLSEGTGLRETCEDVDVVLHLAASMTGASTAHDRDTLSATRQLLTSLPEGARLVLLSSIAVYDTAAVEQGDMITEKTPLLDPGAPAAGDAYALAKRRQELLVTQAQTAGDLQATILRAGAVFGTGRLWNAHIGPMLGPLLLRMGGQGEIPLCHVSTCATALVTAAELPATGPINLVDEDLPDRRRYLKALRSGPRAVVPVNWRWACPAAWLAARLARPERLPGLLRPEVLRARFLPVHYDNSRMRSVLGIRQAKGFEALMYEAQQ